MLVIFIAFCCVLILLWRVEIREKRKVEITKIELKTKLENTESKLKIYKDMENYWSNKAIHMEMELDKKLQNCK